MLSIAAGPDALALLRERGLRAGDVRVLVGASGGPKSLVLHGLDHVLFPWLLTGASERTPVHTVGSPIGSWRLSCVALPDPVAALDRLKEAYIEQRYGPAPTPGEVSAEGERIFAQLLGGQNIDTLLANPKLRMHVITTRFKHLGAREGRAEKLAIALAALGNAAHRRVLGAFVERVVFDAANDPGPFAPWRELPTRHAELRAENLHAALMASAAIPAVMAGVIDPPHAPRGTYRDGGITDYHFGHEIDPPEGLALYPHFYSQLTPGWFDKALSWRRTRGLRRMIVLAPSARYVASLPGGRIPDRVDFVKMSDSERIAAWRTVIARRRELGDMFGELVASGRIAHVATPLP
ncbi:MAG TPA: hypothetical protein VF331_16170 [Polyangiales bacterium]